MSVEYAVAWKRVDENFWRGPMIPPGKTEFSAETMYANEVAAQPDPPNLEFKIVSREVTGWS